MEQENRHAELNRRKWDLRAATFERRRFLYFRVLQSLVLRLLDLRPGMRFLDVGCGTGWAVRRVARLLAGRGEFYGVDLSPAMIQEARAASASLENTHFHHADAEDLPLPGEFFDAAICTNSFHHYLNPGKVLRGLHRVLRPGGRLWILDVTADDPLIRSIDRRVREREAEHVRFYGTAAYRAMFREAGLNYLGSRLIAYPEKAHGAEKPA